MSVEVGRFRADPRFKEEACDKHPEYKRAKERRKADGFAGYDGVIVQVVE